MHVAELVRALRERGDIDVRVRCFGAPRDEAGTTGVRRPRRARRRATPRCRPSASTCSMAGDCVGRRPRALAHLVRQLRRPPRLAARRHAARRHRAQPRAAAAVEGRAARRRLPRLVVGRAHGVRGARPPSIAVSAGMREDILRGYPSLDPDAGPGGAQRDRLAAVAAPTRDRGPSCAGTASTPTGRRSSSSAGSPGRRACPTCCARRAELPPDVQLVLCAGAPDTPEIMAEVEGLIDELREPARRRRLDRRHAAAQRGRRAADRGHRLRLPVGLRAARHRQPRGDGVRAAGRRHGDRRHPRGRRRRRDRLAGAHRAGAGRHRHAGRPRPLRRRPRGRAHRGRERHRARRRGWVWRAVAGPWSRSPGARSASRPTRSTWTS